MPKKRLFRAVVKVKRGDLLLGVVGLGQKYASFLNTAC